MPDTEPDPERSTESLVRRAHPRWARWAHWVWFVACCLIVAALVYVAVTIIYISNLTFPSH